FVGKTLLHGDVLMWLMKTLLTSGCTNQRGAGQLADLPMTQQNIIDKLKQYRKETGNVIGKGVNRDAAEIVRKGL
ncbi:hypothetical protein ACOTXO_22350, partial [Enterobacter cloacae complex sp. CDL006]